MRPVLQIPAFRRLLTAYGLNELALAISSLVLAVLVYRRTGSAVGAAGFFLSAQFVPALVSPALVARVERFPFGRLLPLLYGLEALAYGGAGRPRRRLSARPAARAHVCRRRACADGAHAGPDGGRRGDLAGRAPAGGERAHQRGVLGLLRRGSGDRSGARLAGRHQGRAAHQLRAVRRDRADPADRRPAAGRVARRVQRSGAAPRRPATRRLATGDPAAARPPGDRIAVLHDLDPGRGRLRAPCAPHRAGWVWRRCSRSGARERSWGA